MQRRTVSSDSLSLVKREGPSTGPRRRGITELPQWSALPSQSIAKDQPSNTSRPQSRRGPKQRPTLTTTQWTPRGRPTVRGDSRSTTWLPEMGLRCVLNDWDSLKESPDHWSHTTCAYNRQSNELTTLRRAYQRKSFYQVAQTWPKPGPALLREARSPKMDSDWTDHSVVLH